MQRKFKSYIIEDGYDLQLISTDFLKVTMDYDEIGDIEPQNLKEVVDIVAEYEGWEFISFFVPRNEFDDTSKSYVEIIRLL